MDQVSASLEVLKQQLPSKINTNTSLEKKAEISAKLLEKIRAKFVELEANLQTEPSFILSEYRDKVIRIFNAISPTLSPDEDPLRLIDAIYKEFPPSIVLEKVDISNPLPPSEKPGDIKPDKVDPRNPLPPPPPSGKTEQRETNKVDPRNPPPDPGNPPPDPINQLPPGR